MAVNIGTDAAKAVLKDETRERDRIEDELDDDDVVRILSFIIIDWSIC